MDFRRSFSSLSTCPDIYNWNGSYNLILEHYNFTGRLQHRKPSKTSAGIITVLFLCVSIFIVLENLMVLLAVLFRVRLRHRWIFICISNIALSDLLTGSAYVVNICMSGERTFKLSPVLWLFREGLLFVALAASIFSLLLIAVERYATMMKPVHQKTATKTYRIYIMVGLCWMTALVIGFLPLMGWNCLCNLESCSTLLPLYSKSYILFALVIFFIILLTIGALYFAIYCHVRSSTETMMTVRSSKRSLRLLKAVISIVGVFMVCWGPLFILLLVDFFCYSRRCSTLFSPGWVIAMAVLNSAMNPLIYSFGSLELRKAISTLLCCCCVKAGLVDPKTLKSKETSSTSGSRHSSLRNSFSKVRNLSTSPPPEPKSKKTRLSSTTSCLSASSG